MARPDMLARAIELATKAHEGQTRRGGEPYINHPLSVMSRLAALEASNLTLQAAVLHDVLEDTSVGLDDLETAGFSQLVCWAVYSLTKKPEQTTVDYYLSVYRDRIARAVKIADIIDNLTGAPTAAAVERYTKGLLILSGVY